MKSLAALALLVSGCLSPVEEERTRGSVRVHSVVLGLGWTVLSVRRVETNRTRPDPTGPNQIKPDSQPDPTRLWGMRNKDKSYQIRSNDYPCRGKPDQTRSNQTPNRTQPDPDRTQTGPNRTRIFVPCKMAASR